jgi:hypothetical protein
MKVSGEDLLGILPAIDRVSRQVIKPVLGCVSQVNGEELDNEQVIIHPVRLAQKVVVLQPNVEIGFMVIFDDVVWCPKTFREARLAHVAPKCFGPWPFEAKATPLSVTMPATAQDMDAVLEMLPLIPLLSLTVR